MNLDSGGSPPIDSRVAMVRVVIIGILFHVCDSDSGSGGRAVNV